MGAWWQDGRYAARGKSREPQGDAIALGPPILMHKVTPPHLHLSPQRPQTLPLLLLTKGGCLLRDQACPRPHILRCLSIHGHVDGLTQEPLALALLPGQLLTNLAQLLLEGLTCLSIRRLANRLREGMHFALHDRQFGISSIEP